MLRSFIVTLIGLFYVYFAENLWYLSLFCRYVRGIYSATYDYFYVYFAEDLWYLSLFMYMLRAFYSDTYSYFMYTLMRIFDI